MNAPTTIHRFDPPTIKAFSELARVRLVEPALTDDGITVPAGTRGTVVGVWVDGRSYEVDFAAGLATVEAAHLVASE